MEKTKCQTYSRIHFFLLFSVLILSACTQKSQHTINLGTIPSPIIFQGDDETAYRDPAVLFENNEIHLFFTLVEIEHDGSIYSYVAHSKSKDLIHWSPIEKITEKNQKLNYSSPGNVIRYNNEWLLCFQTYPRPDYNKTQKIRYGNETARLFIMRSKDLKKWSSPEMLKVKGNEVLSKDMGRMIDPYLVQDKDDLNKYWCFYKQNGVSLSYTYDFVSWTYFGRTDAGENVCILVENDEYIMFHSPHNGIGIKKSTDLINWNDWGELITLGQDKWDWAKGRITAGAVIDLRAVEGVERYLMFFHGSGPLTESEGDFDKNSSIGIAWSTDLKKWEWPLKEN